MRAKLLVVAGIAVIALTVMGCAGEPIGGTAFVGHQIRRFHDDSLDVTCYTVYGEGAMSCMPDWFIHNQH